MYIDSLAYQTREFFYSLGFGFLLGFIYDFTNFLRLCFSKSRRKYYISDIVFAVISALLCMIFSLGVCRGKFAFYVILGTVSGFAIYRLSLSQMVKPFTDKAAEFFKRSMCTIKKYSCNLFFKCFKSIKKLFNKQKVQKNKKISKKHLQDKQYM